MSRIGDVRRKFAGWWASRKAVERARAWWDGLDEEPYVVEYRVPATQNLANLKIDQIRGLAAAYSVLPNATTSGDPLVISHWRTELSFRKGRIEFAKGLGLAGTTNPVREGHQLQSTVRSPRFGWFRRHIELVIGLIGLAAGIIGNVEKLRDPAMAVFLRPKAQISAARERIDVLVGDEFDAEFTMRNVSDWVSGDVEFTAAEVKPPGALELDTPIPGPFIGVKPGATETIKVHGVASPLFRGGETSLTFPAIATNWLGRENKLISNRPEPFHLSVMVWPRQTVGTQTIGDIAEHGMRGRVDCQFMIGEEFAAGFEVQVQLKTPADLRIDRVQFPGTPELRRLDTAELIQVRWTTKSMAPRKRHQFSVYLKGKSARTRDEWDEVAKRVQISFGGLKPTK